MLGAAIGSPGSSVEALSAVFMVAGRLPMTAVAQARRRLLPPNFQNVSDTLASVLRGPGAADLPGLGGVGWLNDIGTG